MANFQTPTPVQITPIDLGEIKKENTLAAMYNQRLQDAQYETGSRNALNDVLKADPNATGQNVLSQMAARGFGKEGQSYSYNWANRQHANLQYEMDLRKEVSNLIGSVTDENSKNQAIDYIQSKFPDADFSQFRAMPWQDAVKQGNNFALGAAGRVSRERQDKAAVAAGYQPGMDLSTLHTAQGMENAAAAEGRAQAVFPGQQQQQAATLEHTQASTDALKDRRKVVMMPDPSDWTGKKKIPGILIPGQNGEPDTTMPLNSNAGGQGFGGNAPQSGSMTPGASAGAQNGTGQVYVQRGNGQILTPDTAAKYAKAAGGDRAKAEEMARADGWGW
ncbi:hypothetical protein [Desulfovibrio sp. TomC]|uniref:hypothetical protein n=1 Tax=Desulfovibrio sp. TomC TaxID=1562888 RepID=UPI00057441D7|nr:hypothetical protein [Desulfovibrio sp. TomC]KHK02360.1 hypothetical protein NY78_2118 [Desulfovibrio sp. TomC]